MPITAPFRRLGQATAAMALCLGLASAQAPPAVPPAQAPAAAPFAFDIVSVKPAAPEERGGIIRPDPGYQTYIVQNVPLLVIMTVAYHVTPRQISGGPGWINSDRWDITAKADAPGTIDQLHRALQQVLEDRFQLKIRHETRQEPVYDLVVEPSGAKMTPHTPPHDTDSPPIGGGVQNGTLTFNAKNVAMDYFAFFLSGVLGKGVIDQTGLADHYDFQVHFPFQPGGRRGGPGSAEATAPAAPDFSPLFAALRAQLGLRLVSAKGPADHLVIESASKPSAN